jgi:hypothetical protein
MHQALQGATFHIEHVIPRSKGGPTRAENLAFACPSCNLKKSNRIRATDPSTGSLVTLFDPRRDVWREHFVWRGYRMAGISPIGRATVNAFDLNNTRRIRV